MGRETNSSLTKRVQKKSRTKNDRDNEMELKHDKFISVLTSNEKKIAIVTII